LLCLTPVQQFFSYIMARTSSLSTRWWGPLCTNTPIWICIVLCGRHVAPLNTLFRSEPTSLCFNSLMLRVWLRSDKYQFYSLWFDTTGSRTHDLPHSKQAYLPLLHRWSSDLINIIRPYLKQVVCLPQCKKESQ
jgi:hypothetical protein